MFLLLLTTSASTCPKNSRNLGMVFKPRPIHIRNIKFSVLSVCSNARLCCHFPRFLYRFKIPLLGDVSAKRERTLGWARKIRRVSPPPPAPKTTIDEKGAAHAGARALCSDGRENENPAKKKSTSRMGFNWGHSVKTTTPL